MRTIIPRSIVGIDSSTRIPTPNLPPPYTSGTWAGQSRPTDPSELTATSKLLIGPKSTPFLIHTRLLTAQSSYFRVALTGPFAESTANTITLDDVSVDHFQLVISWLYNGILTAPFKDGKPAYYTLLHVYVLADRFALEGLRNAVLDMMSDLSDRTNSVLTPSDTRILYGGIRDSAPLRRLVLDLFAFKKTDRLLEMHGDWWHAEFLRDLS
ncbi:btb poz domain containing protein [Pyrenophora tritici-repentis]|uniref:BTB/POZ domain containing protein n=1 Tax=Pyrenophora tritici-repentis TaxID=45151 RepID=A0A2W1HLQ5_9PLEO|nr:btb poz domain-containing protein [Pyrenophora tritici-repentis]KAF7445101.1 btb poz domain containing protein [Pyrenophora tritici-repentis]KAF7565371.1 putative btb poz domain containing protein [Pyrenophora tritici-repentis]KAG9380492.1 btb poz domain containing protein [Pyrenophora tritici-repentis]KAI0582682.1 btb poz domain-containing protein [Pyrenophora tritici-repentis]